MKKIFLFSIASLLLSFSGFSQKKTKVWLDRDGKTITKNKFNKQLKEDHNSMWIFIDSLHQKRAKIIPRYNLTQLNYTKLRELLSQKSSEEFPKDAPFLIEYNFMYDLCRRKPQTKINKGTFKNKIEATKIISQNLKKEFDNLIYLDVYEKDLLKESLEEFPHIADDNNILKEVLFQNPAYCGAYAIIKPNGNALVINGESRIDYIAATYLDPDNWNLFFSNEEYSLFFLKH